ncbi:WD repeat-containing protein 82 [Coemansia javaensis]|uniref:WD repeat-containing protein 82 n=1 Tax=Coemansia javaensis TaxID=2761396 RepID=A0A9W8HJ43_9FUNG|nr:WD repeat-containing protein 82 [Coemansia javaensis]
MDPEIDPETLAALRRDPLRQALTGRALRSFQMAKVFSDNKAAVTSLDYDGSGTRCITTSRDESLRIYDCERGVRAQVSYSKKYGCNLAQFTAQAGCAAYASTKINDTIRYLSCDTNQYIRYFVGHRAAVTSLQRAPDGAAGAPALLSAAMDGSVRLWDLDRPDAVCALEPPAPGSVARGGIAAAYDPSGAVVAVAVGSAELQLYDVRELARGPFLSAPMDRARGAAVARVQFVPPAGDCILLAMTDGTIAARDAFSLRPLATLSRAEPGAHPPADPEAPVLGEMRRAFLGQNVTATPDGRAIVAGCASGGVAFWDTARVLAQDHHHHNHPGPARHLDPDGVWSGSHDGPVSACAFNPCFLECVTGSDSLALWTTP